MCLPFVWVELKRVTAQLKIKNATLKLRVTASKLWIPALIVNWAISEATKKIVLKNISTMETNVKAPKAFIFNSPSSKS